MEVSTVTVVSVLMAVMLVIPGLYSLPLDVDATQDEVIDYCKTVNTYEFINVYQQLDQHIEQKRPKYMDTRELDEFKELVLMSIKKLAKENMIQDIVVDNSEEQDGSVEKRRRHVSMCFRRSGGYFLPYPCYKYSGRR